MTRQGRFFAVPLALVVMAACSLRAAACGASAPGATDQPAPAEAASAAGQAAGEQPVDVVCLGDSLTAGLGLLSEEAYPFLIQQKFAEEGYVGVTVINAGVSGDTTAGALRRVTDLLGPSVKVLVVALGGDDALRGLSTAETKANLAAIIQAARTSGARVLLAGMQAPASVGDDYRQAFNDLFVRLALDNHDIVSFMPFLLEGVAGNPTLNQADGIYPNGEGAQVIASNMYPIIRGMIDQMGGGG
jgi:acyl-CoA thioesterase I